MQKKPIVISWSGGKDCVMTLREIWASDEYQVVALLTVCTEGFRRIKTHGVRCSLLREQAASLGIPLRKIFVPRGPCSNSEYEGQLNRALLEFKSEGVSTIAFGDLYLEDIRRYRDRMLEPSGVSAVYPLWGRNTASLAREFIDQGFKAAVVCVNPELLDRRFAGRQFDQALLRDLPARVDPCGENGEFHTFVFDGPGFRFPISVRAGAMMERDHFYYADLRFARTQDRKNNAKTT